MESLTSGVSLSKLASYLAAAQNPFKAFIFKQSKNTLRYDESLVGDFIEVVFIAQIRQQTTNHMSCHAMEGTEIRKSWYLDCCSGCTPRPLHERVLVYKQDDTRADAAFGECVSLGLPVPV